MGKYLICVSGASGSIYGIRTMQALIENGHEVHAVVSSWGAQVLEQETGRPFAAWLETLKIPPERIYAPHDMGALPASGSFRPDGTRPMP
jgi:4-hydroxy-3-polyprenylbenzoate decarboxylase